MKYCLALLICIFSLTSYAQFEPDNEYMDISRDYFGSEISPGLYEIVQPAAFDARVHQLTTDDNDSSIYSFVLNTGVYSGGQIGSKGTWQQVVRTPLAEPSYELPSIFVFSLPKSNRRFAVVGLPGEINAVFASDGTEGRTSLTVTSTTTDFEGSAERLVFRIEFRASASNAPVPVKIVKFE